MNCSMQTADPTFDRITARTARLLNVPGVSLSLVDRTRQFMKSSFRMEGAMVEARRAVAGGGVSTSRRAVETLAVGDATALASSNLEQRHDRALAYAPMPPHRSMWTACPIGALCVC